MPRPKTDEVKPKLPDVVEQDFDVWPEGAYGVASLLERTAELKKRIETDKLALESNLELLLEIQNMAGLTGLRHNNITYTSRMQDGRRTQDKKKFEELLLAAGVHINVIKKATEDSMKQGESFWVREISIG